MSVKNFENNRWGGGDQEFVFRHAKALELIEDGQMVLDIGCGDGLFLSALAERGITGFGVDVSEEGARKCREKGLDVSVFDITTNILPFKDCSFDIVTILDVLEHVYEPDKLLKEAARVSKKYVVISVPNFNSLPARLQVVFGNVPENNRPNKGHVYWFNYRNLVDMLKKNNLEILVSASNSFFDQKFFVGLVMKVFVNHFPSICALSFVVKAKKIAHFSSRSFL